MRRQSFMQSFQLMLGVLSRSCFMCYSGIKQCFWRAATGQMPIAHCVGFLMVVNLLYFLVCDQFVIGLLGIGDMRLMPLSMYILICLWQCSVNIHSRFVRFVVRLLVFFLALQMTIRMTIEGGLVPGIDLATVVVPEPPLSVSQAST